MMRNHERMKAGAGTLPCHIAICHQMRGLEDASGLFPFSPGGEMLTGPAHGEDRKVWGRAAAFPRGLPGVI